MRILIVEDSQALAQALERGLVAEGHVCDRCETGEAALSHLERFPYDLVALDLMLPGLDGFGVLRALQRRPREQAEPVLSHAGIRLDPRTRIAHRGGAALDLTPKEYALLELLLRQRGRVLSRVQIFERLYDGASETSDKAVEVIVSTLRAKLTQAGADADLIQTRRGFGYVIA